MADPTVSSTDVESLPAFDRVQSRPGPAPSTPGVPLRPMWRPRTLILIAVGLSLVGGLAWWLWPSPSTADDVLLHLVETSDSFMPERMTTEPDVAREVVLEELGWDVAPPDLPSLAIVGVGVPSIGSVQVSPASSPTSVQVPAFRYEGATGERATVYAYDYILLDRVGEAFDLPEGTYAALSEPTPVDSRVVEGQFVITWRLRAMIFTAVTPDEQVGERIPQAVSS